MKGLVYLFEIFEGYRQNDTPLPVGFWESVSKIWSLERDTTPESARKRFYRKYKRYVTSEAQQHEVLEELEEADEIISRYVDLEKISHSYETESNSEEDVKSETEKIEETYDENNNYVIDSKSTRIKTEAQLIEHCNVDLTVWERDRLVVNKWEVGAKNKEGDIVVEPLYQVKIWFKPRVEAILTKQYVEELASSLKRVSTPVPKRRLSGDEEFMYEIAIPDLHFGKLGWDKEVGYDYDIKEARRLFLWAIEDLLNKVSHKKIAKIVLPIGNDLFQVDTINNTTTKGTLVDADTRWQKSFSSGISMINEGIAMCEKVAPVDVYMVPGNHDFERTFYAGTTLEAWYHNNPNVTIFNSPKSRKAVRYGSAFIMYTHGNEEKVNQLPLVMFAEFPESAQCKFKEIHIGHTHKKKDVQYVLTDEYQGVRVSVLPSLCPPDAWHYKKGYIENIRSAEGRLYHKERGNEGIFPCNVV